MVANLYSSDRRQSEIAQSVEQMAVNHWVVGSSPTLGELILFIFDYIFQCQLRSQLSKL